MTFTARRLVEFRDTDAAGILHFASYFAYMESVEHEFLRSLGTSVMMRDDLGELGWPRVAAQCDYREPVRFEDELEIELGIERLGSKSVTYQHTFRCQGRDTAVGKLTVVCCRMTEAGLASTSIPAVLAEQLRPHLLS